MAPVDPMTTENTGGDALVPERPRKTAKPKAKPAKKPVRKLGKHKK